MTYKKSMLYGIYALGLAQFLTVLYGYFFNSLNELGSATIPISILVIIVMAIFGVIPGAVVHFLKSKLPNIPPMILGFIVFLGLNTLGYTLTEEIKESITEIIYSSFTFSVCGIFMGFLYSKSTPKTINEIT